MRDLIVRIEAMPVPARERFADAMIAKTREFLSERWELPDDCKNRLRRWLERRRELDEITRRMDRFLQALDGTAQLAGRPNPLPKQKRGRRPKLRRRRIQIAFAVAALVEAGLFPPTRSHARRRKKSPSACSIVKTALAQLGEHMAERTVEDIWRRYKGLVIPHARRGQNDSALASFVESVILPETMHELERTPPNVR
jgi:hypothetical protein